MLMLEHTCDIWRNAALGTNGRTQLQSLYTGVSCLLLPLNSQTTITEGFSLGRGYETFFEDDQDVKIGDRLVRSGKNYTVKYVETYETPLAAHLRVLCEQEAF